MDMSGHRSSIEKNMYSNSNSIYASGFNGTSTFDDSKKATRSKSVEHSKNIDNEFQARETSMDDSISKKQRFRMDPLKKSFEEAPSHLAKSGINKEYLSRIEPNHNSIHHEQLSQDMEQIVQQTLSKKRIALDKDKLSDRQAGKHKGSGAPRATSSSFEQAGQGSSADLLSGKKSLGSKSFNSEMERNNEYDHSSHSWESHKHFEKKQLPAQKFKNFGQKSDQTSFKQEPEQKADEIKENSEKEWIKERTDGKQRKQQKQTPQLKQDQSQQSELKNSAIKWEEDDIDPSKQTVENKSETTKTTTTDISSSFFKHHKRTPTIIGDIFDVEDFNKEQQFNQQTENTDENLEQQEEEEYDEDDVFDLDRFNEHIKNKDQDLQQQDEIKQEGELEQQTELDQSELKEENTDLKQQDEVRQEGNLEQTQENEAEQVKEIDQSEMKEENEDLKQQDENKQEGEKFDQKESQQQTTEQKQQQQLLGKKHQYHPNKADKHLEKALQSLPKFENAKTRKQQQRKLAREAKQEEQDKSKTSTNVENLDGRAADKVLNEESSKKIDDTSADWKSFENPAYIGEDVEGQHGKRTESFVEKTIEDKPNVGLAKEQTNFSEKQQQKGNFVGQQQFQNLQQNIETETQ